jgi:hypothetical protein
LRLETSPDLSHISVSSSRKSTENLSLKIGFFNLNTPSNPDCNEHYRANLFFYNIYEL